MITFRYARHGQCLFQLSNVSISTWDTIPPKKNDFNEARTCGIERDEEVSWLSGSEMQISPGHELVDHRRSCTIASRLGDRLLPRRDLASFLRRRWPTLEFFLVQGPWWPSHAWGMSQWNYSDRRVFCTNDEKKIMKHLTTLAVVELGMIHGRVDRQSAFELKEGQR